MFLYMHFFDLISIHFLEKIIRVDFSLEIIFLLFIFGKNKLPLLYFPFVFLNRGKRSMDFAEEILNSDSRYLWTIPCPSDRCCSLSCSVFTFGVLLLVSIYFHVLFPCTLFHEIFLHR